MHRSANHLIQGLKLSEDFSVKGGPGANSLRMLRDIGGGGMGSQIINFPLEF